MIVFTSKPQPGVTALEPRGRLDTAAVPKLETAVNDALSSGGALVIDLGSTTYIASMALRVLLFAAKGMAAKGGHFAVAAPGGNIADVLRMAGFASILHLHENLPAALADVRQKTTKGKAG
jgi:anti-anti-sigma factor